MSSDPTTTKGNIAIHRRLGFGAIALACGLVAATGDAAARQGTAEEIAYCSQLYGKFARYHFNLYHHDGTWARAELAKIACAKGDIEAGTKELELILQEDRWPLDGRPTSIGSAPR